MDSLNNSQRSGRTLFRFFSSSKLQDYNDEVESGPTRELVNHDRLQKILGSLHDDEVVKLAVRKYLILKNETDCHELM